MVVQINNNKMKPGKRSNDPLKGTKHGVKVINRVESRMRLPDVRGIMGA